MVWFKVKGTSRCIGVPQSNKIERILNQMKTKGLIIGKDKQYNLMDNEGCEFLGKEIGLKLRCWK